MTDTDTRELLSMMSEAACRWFGPTGALADAERYEAAKAALLTHLTALEQQVAGEDARVRAAIEPVLHWYESDEHEPRPTVDILADIVADLQEDRKAALAADARVKAAVERETERCAGIATDRAAGRWRFYEENGASINAHKAAEAEDIAIEIRATAISKGSNQDG